MAHSALPHALNLLDEQVADPVRVERDGHCERVTLLGIVQYAFDHRRRTLTCLARQRAGQWRRDSVSSDVRRPIGNLWV